MTSHRKRRTIGRKITALVVVIAVAAWVAILAFGGAGAPRPQSASAAEASAQASPIEVGVAHPAESFPTLEGSKPIFILVLGSGARPPTPPDKGLADSIHIVSYNPQQQTGSILGIPRDSWVPIPGHGSTKINNAMAWGGPQLQIQTVENLTGIHIDFYMVTGFAGFENFINALPRIKFIAPYDMHDPYSKADVKKGANVINGHGALGVVRDRHDVPNGDFSRSSNGGLMLLAILTQFRKQFGQDPSRFLTYFGAGLGNVKTNIPYDQLVTLALTSRLVNPKSVVNIVAAGSIGNEQGLSTVDLSSSNKKIYADMKDDGIISKNAKGAPV
jgi:LCP family protein required for cell wall assembly